MASGLDYTILRCGFLMEIMVAPIVGFDYANAKAVVYGSGENPLSLLSMDDVARMVRPVPRYAGGVERGRSSSAVRSRSPCTSSWPRSRT